MTGPMNMLKTGALATVLALGAAGAQAANEWGIPGEEKARFDAKVVDILCELNGDCPENCGDGTRQLGLLTADGVLVLAMKNRDPFAGAATDLAPFCGKTVTADGLMIENEAGYRFFALQFVREAPDGKWSGATQFVKSWAAANGVAADSAQAKQWFRNDPVVKERIAEEGKLGLGPAEDEKFLSSQ